MGIQPDVALYIARLAKSLPKGFSVCELGDQGMCGNGKGHLSKDWYEQNLGCGRYVSIDGNGRGTLTIDLNQSFDGWIEDNGPFDLVTDCGTGEHIFDQAQVWRTLHELTKPGGYIVFDRPAQGYDKHCYYLVNECLYQDIAEANHYRLPWLLRDKTPRGELIRGCFQRPDTLAPFVVPQQGRYQKSLVI